VFGSASTVESAGDTRRRLDAEEVRNGRDLVSLRDEHTIETGSKISSSIPPFLCVELWDRDPCRVDVARVDVASM
jgi:hypothetical protein